MVYEVTVDWAAFLSHVRSIGVDGHILKGRSGSEENVKIKMVVPLLQVLGWDLLEDMDFEHRRADIVLHSEGQPAILVEVKSWSEEITGYLDQCLGYSLRLKTPWEVITSGRDTALYSSWLDAEDLLRTQPLYRFSFQHLLAEDAERVLRDLSSLIGKEAFATGHRELSTRVEERLEASDLSEARAEFDEQASGFEGEIRSHRLTVDQFMALSGEHPEPVRNGLLTMYEGIIELAKLDERVRVRYRSKNIGLEYRLETQSRARSLGLVGTYPESAHVSFGLEHWKQANLPKRLYQQIAKYPRQVRSQEWAESLLRLLREAILEIAQLHFADDEGNVAGASLAEPRE